MKAATWWWLSVGTPAAPEGFGAVVVYGTTIGDAAARVGRLRCLPAGVPAAVACPPEWLARIPARDRMRRLTVADCRRLRCRPEGPAA